MMKRVASLALVAGAVAMSFAAGAAPQWQGPGKAPKWSGPGVPHAMFVHPAPQPALNYPAGHAPAATLAQWNGSFTDLHGHNITYTMVGADPATSNAETHVTVFLIPVIFAYGASNGNMTLDPRAANTGVYKTKSVMQALLKSPMFDPGADFKSGNIDCGTGQYIDIYQRCNFWSSVSTNTGYHTILDVVKNKHLKPMKITVTAAQGSIISNPFGDGVVGTYNYTTFQGNASSYISAHTADITPDKFPFFISYDVYLTSGGCCIGGYHNRIGGHGTGQTYGYTTYVDHDASFSEDISAVSHEVGEWLDDPFVDNHVFCNDNSIMENGDPLVPVGQYGTFTQSLHGKTWHPQSLVFIPYFGAPTSISANGWYALHGTQDISHTCPGQ